MDLEKVKSSYKWDPMGGDYSKSFVSYERNIIKKKRIRSYLLTALYIIALIVIVAVVFVQVL